MNTQLELNKKTLEYFKKHFEKSNDWYGYNGICSVPITDVFPNTRAFQNGCEFEIETPNSFTNEPIDVYIDKFTGRLFIEDGHNRFASFIQDGVDRIEVNILGESVFSRVILRKAGLQF